MYLEKKSWLHHKLIRIPNPGVEPVACCTPQGWRWPLRRSPAPWGHPIHQEGLNAGWNGEAELGWSRGDGEKKAILWTEYSKRHGFRDTKVPCRYIYWEKKKHLVHSTPSVWTGRVWKEKAMKGEIMQRKKGEGVTVRVWDKSNETIKKASDGNNEEPNRWKHGDFSLKASQRGNRANTIFD